MIVEVSERSLEEAIECGRRKLEHVLRNLDREAREEAGGDRGREQELRLLAGGRRSIPGGR